MSFLYIVATPLGNIDDLSRRAIDILSAVDLILAEDTRVTGKLLEFFKIQKPLLSLHQHSGAKEFKRIREVLDKGKDAALVTDAGTPGIADPGGALIAYIAKSCPQVSVTPIPGPSALTAALSVAGFPADQFVFLGFPPHKKRRAKFFQKTKELSQEFTVVLYESTHRIKKTLRELQAILNPGQKVMIGRELTKKFETIYRCAALELAALDINEKGEFVIVINKVY